MGEDVTLWPEREVGCDRFRGKEESQEFSECVCIVTHSLGISAYDSLEFLSVSVSLLTISCP